jgi:hypothetical protein
MKIDKRVEKNIASVNFICQLLKEVIKNPESYLSQESLRKALLSQGALSKYLDENRSIYPSSLNTLKRSADRLLPDGFEGLDKLRRHAYQVLADFQSKKENSVKKDSKFLLNEKIAQLKKENQELKEYLYLLTNTLSISLVQGATYAKQSNIPTLFARCKKDQNELLRTLSLIKIPLGNKVVRINSE